MFYTHYPLAYLGVLNSLLPRTGAVPCLWRHEPGLSLYVIWAGALRRKVRCGSADQPVHSFKGTGLALLLGVLLFRGFDKHGAHLKLHVPGNLLARGDLSVLRSREVKHLLEKKYRRR